MFRDRIGVRLEDTAYIDLFVDFNNMVDAGNKVSYAVAVLADKYDVSERKVYRFQVNTVPGIPSVKLCLLDMFREGAIERLDVGRILKPLQSYKALSVIGPADLPGKE